MRYLTAILFVALLALAASLGGCRHADDPDIYRSKDLPTYVEPY